MANFLPWSKEEEARLAELWLGGMPMKEIVQRFEREENTIRARLKKLGLPKRARGGSAKAELRSVGGGLGNWTPERVEQLKALWTDGCSATEVGLALGISRGAVIGKVHRLDLPERQTGVSGGGKSRKVAAEAKPAREAVAAGGKGRTGRRHGPARAAVTVKPFDARVVSAVPLEPIRAGDMVTIVDLSTETAVPHDRCGPRQCRWPLWPSVRFGDLPEAERLMCGAATAEPGAPYCEMHHGRAFVAGRAPGLGAKPLPRDMAGRHEFQPRGRGAA